MMSVEQFRNFYLSTCREHQLDPPAAVMEAIQTAHASLGGGGLCLNLSTHSLPPKACAILAVCLEKDRTFQELMFNDCMLAEDGLKHLVNAIQGSTFCTRLELKGNNIRGATCEALGRLLKYNKTLKILNLEWNQLGMVDSSFALFCEGLGHSTSLEILDLRNNQLSHECAKELAQALKRNLQLKVLDLRWNNVGLLGGRALLTALEANRTVVKMELSGNSVPPDLLKSIDTALGHNEERTKLSKEHRARTDLLSRELQEKDKRQKRQVMELLSRMDERDSQTRISSRQNLHKIGQLQELLDERKHACHNLTSRLSMSESKLAVAETKLKEVERVADEEREERERQARQHIEEMKKEREDRMQAETKLLKEISELNEKRSSLDAQVEELDRKCRAQKEQLFDLKEQLTNNQADMKLKQAQLDDRLQMERQRFKDDMQEVEAMKQKEVARVRAECDEAEKTWRERVTRLEQQRAELEEECGRLRNAVTAEKLHAEEQVMQARHRLRQEEEGRCHQLEEKIRFLEGSRDELEQRCSLHQGNIQDLTKKNAAAKMEAETLRHRIEALQQELATKDADTLTEVGRVRLESQQRIQRLEAERQSKDDLYSKIDQLEQSARDAARRNREEQEERERELVSTRERLRLREQDLQRLLDDQQQREASLQSAIAQYCRPSVTLSNAATAATAANFLSRGAKFENHE